MGGSRLPTDQVWKLNPTTYQWAWISGNSAEMPFANAVYGTMRVPSASNVAPSRAGAGVALDRNTGMIYVSVTERPPVAGTDCLKSVVLTRRCVCLGSACVAASRCFSYGEFVMCLGNPTAAFTAAELIAFVSLTPVCVLLLLRKVEVPR